MVSSLISLAKTTSVTRTVPIKEFAGESFCLSTMIELFKGLLCKVSEVASV